MTIATEFGNFGSFKDLNIFMRLEEKASVFISSVEWWGIDCNIFPHGATYTREEIETIVNS